MPINILAQAIGLLGMGTLFIMYQQSSKKRYLTFKLLSDVVWATHYLLLSAIGGAIPNIMGVARELIFINEDKKWANKKVWAAIFITFNTAFALSLTRSVIQFMPIAASALVTVSLTFKNTKNIRLITLPISITFLIYDIVVGSWAGALNESISLISIISKLAREMLSKTNEWTNN